MKSSPSERTLAINNSPSKARFAFGQDSRFKPIKKPVNIHAYDLPDHFRISMNKSPMSPPFGTGLRDRFDYLDQKRRQALPSPGQYEAPDEKTSEPSSPAKHKYSFGASRDTTQKLYVDEILNQGSKSLLSPGPGRYNAPATFGKAGAKISFGLNTSIDDIKLKKLKDMPGPGQYRFPDQIMDQYALRQLQKSQQLTSMRQRHRDNSQESVGSIDNDSITRINLNRETSISQMDQFANNRYLSKGDTSKKDYTYSHVSIKKNPRGQKFSQARDRFFMPKDSIRNPGPGNYSPKHNLGQDRFAFKQNAKAVIGKSTIDVLDLHSHQREKQQVPGPGAYASFSEFSQVIK